MKPDPVFPPVASLLPHRGRALLLDRVLAHDPAGTVCTVDPEAGAHFRDADGSIPAYIGLEYMAQTIAAHGGLLELAKKRDNPGPAVAAKTGTVPVSGSGATASMPDARPGFFVGTRRIAFHVDCFARGQALTVSAVHLRSSAALHAFDCSITDGADGAATSDRAGALTLVSGVLTVYLLESLEALARDFSAND